MSKTEELLKATIEGTDVSNYKCRTRMEHFLKKCACGEVCDDMTPRTRTEELLKALSVKIAEGGSGSGGGVIEVEELPQIGWSGTTVPNTGTLETIYFNPNMSVEETENLLSKLTYIDGILDYPTYVIAYSFEEGADEPSYGLVATKVENVGYCIVDATTNMPVFDTIGMIPEIDTGWLVGKTIGGKEVPGSQTLNLPLTNELGGFLIGYQNDLISSIVSTTPFVQTEAPVEGSVYKVGGATAVPTSGYVEKLYFNTSLSREEVNKILGSLTPNDIRGNDTYYNALFDNEGNSLIFIGINSIFIEINGGALYYEDDWNASVGTEWQPNPFEVNREVSTGGYVIDQNDKLKDLISITPFTDPKYYLVENGQFVELKKEDNMVQVIDLSTMTPDEYGDIQLDLSKNGVYEITSLTGVYKNSITLKLGYCKNINRGKYLLYNGLVGGFVASERSGLLDSDSDINLNGTNISENYRYLIKVEDNNAFIFISEEN